MDGRSTPKAKARDRHIARSQDRDDHGHFAGYGRKIDGLISTTKKTYDKTPSWALPAVVGGGLLLFLLWPSSASASSLPGATAATATSPGSSTDGKGPRAGFASNPEFQWTYVVRNGEGASQIAKKITGSDLRYPELLAANPTPNAFAPGARILIPRTWNAYVDETGNYRSSSTPFPIGPPR